MIDIKILRDNANVVILGSHAEVIQSMLDYDFLAGKSKPSIVAIIASGRKQERYFWGETEVTIRVFANLELVPEVIKNGITAALNVQSARRILSSTMQAVELLPNLQVVDIFAEQTPESHSLELIKLAATKNVLIVGPASVGVLIPGFLKLGAIGGTRHPQISSADILEMGDTAVVSTSGGMVNELIHTVTGVGFGISFAMALGGDRFPITTPAQALQLAEADKHTKRIVYFGELGGSDEYEIAQLIDEGKITKELIVYIAGTVAELFEEPPQFGHAKALAQTKDESATAKKDALRKAGAIVANTFADVHKELAKRVIEKRVVREPKIGARKHSMIVSHISGEIDENVVLLGKDLMETVENNSIASLVLSLLLGEQVESKKAISFVDFVFKLLVDHGPYVSGALNTIVSARAGKDLVSSLTAGLMTIGPRFGGAINGAATEWVQAVKDGVSPQEFVEAFAKRGGIIPGIGHKKYTIDMPDPRVKALKTFAKNTNGDRYLQFALGVEAITTTKKTNLILNVDGTIAAVLLDILESEFNYDQQQLLELSEIEFFNALFVLSRSIGFTAHYLDQRRHDEGLLRLSPDDVRYIE
ncbi:MAG: ATP-citrate synthase [Candidatus Saccharibacteria bacterium]|nr:ATP-citrate synthase [Candidatus Saccharibacteria bacterium]